MELTVEQKSNRIKAIAKLTRSVSLDELKEFVMVMTSEETGYALGGDYSYVLGEILSEQFWYRKLWENKIG